MRKYFYIISTVLLFAGCSKVQQQAITSQEMSELLQLSDTSNMTSELMVEDKLSRITHIFQIHNDNRGLFPLVYEQTTHQALLSLKNEPEKYTDIKKAKAITIAFAKRFLFNLHDHLTGKETEYHWKNYYTLCFSHQSQLRILCAGLNAHLTVDLARSVYDVNGRVDFKNDYIKFGEALVKASPFIIDELDKQYHVESGYLFHGLFIGDILDPVFGQDFTTQFAFQFIREEAFQNGQYLLSPAAYDNAQNALHTNWQFREQLLDALVKSKLI
ncbi:MAG: hypothetical protein JWN78_1801 [Bacteroidota bacterium]|nr:hypothetical protein [Bacteroidota bacterium]